MLKIPYYITMLNSTFWKLFNFGIRCNIWYTVYLTMKYSISAISQNLDRQLYFFMAFLAVSAQGASNKPMLYFPSFLYQTTLHDSPAGWCEKASTRTAFVIFSSSVHPNVDFLDSLKRYKWALSDEHIVDAMTCIFQNFVFCYETCLVAKFCKMF